MYHLTGHAVDTARFV